MAKDLRLILTKLTNSQSEFSQAREKLNDLICNNKDLLSVGGFIGEKIKAFNLAYKDFENSYNNFAKYCTQDGANNSEFEQINVLSDFIQINAQINSNKGMLKDWCYLQKLRQQLKEQNIDRVFEAVINNKISNDDIERLFETAYCKWFSNMAISQNQTLREFSSSQHKDKIKQFILKDDEFRQLTIKYIQSKLSEKIPSKDSKDLSAEWKFIQREMQKQRQIKPVRQILAQAKDAVKTLTPCLMMSPLSVAQYLPVSKNNFDVVVFDEASQITVWDAIGTLSRGEQIIVAGDPKQMPPSNFFGRNIEYNEEELGLDEDLESILDELTASSMPTLRLNWHYRSRCESLIAFSNDRYYDNSLVTFPSSNTNQKSVHFRYLEDAIYERGARINPKEAETLVNECTQRLLNPGLKNKSIGIVTFNSDQQKLIEDLLDKQRELHPEIEFAFNSDNPNAVFVKNLETVQGDERDVIMFSTTYGKDKTGKLSMNFGPLNRIGGEKRLNVAFTRARYEMIIYSSMQPEELDLNRTSAKGVEDLKAFLQYAKAGKNALSSNSLKSETNAISDFEQEVANQLKKAGWEVHTKIGASSYRIDLAVVHPDKKDVYLAAIECDGATYYNCANAVDRDKLRKSVLKGLGWNMIKIWSTDWLINKENSVEILDNKLKELYKATKEEQKNSVPA